MTMWSSASFLMSSSGSSFQANESPLHSIAQYIEDYIDLVENVPNDIARQITQLHEHDHRYSQLLEQLETTLDIACGKTNASDLKRRKSMIKLQRTLIDIQEIADDKLMLIQSILDQLDTKARQLDYDYRAVTMSGSNAFNSRGIAHSLSSASGNSVSTNNSSQKSETNNNTNVNSNSNNNPSNLINEGTSNKETNSHNSGAAGPNNNNQSGQTGSSHGMSHGGKRTSRRQTRGNHDNDGSGKRSIKRGIKGSSREMKKSKNMMNNSPPAPLYDGIPIDPDEPTYCLCEQVSFGEMICCDNSVCPIEWFHFSCVSLSTKPKGKWYCPNCRGERSNIPKK